MRVLLVAGLMTLGGAPLVGQSGPGGLWFGAGVGGGASKVGCDLCRGDWEFGPLAQLRMGGTANAHLRYGVEANGWTKNDPDLGVRDIMIGVGAVLYWFPNPATARYYVKGGFGPMLYRAQDSDVGDGDTADPAITSTSFSGQFGIGYEFGGRGLSVVPFFNILSSLYANLHQDGSQLTSVRLNLLQLGITVQRR